MTRDWSWPELVSAFASWLGFWLVSGLKGADDRVLALVFTHVNGCEGWCMSGRPVKKRRKWATTNKLAPYISLRGNPTREQARSSMNLSLSLKIFLQVL